MYDGSKIFTETSTGTSILILTETGTESNIIFLCHTSTGTCSDTTIISKKKTSTTTKLIQILISHYIWAILDLPEATSNSYII